MDDVDDAGMHAGPGPGGREGGRVAICKPRKQAASASTAWKNEGMKEGPSKNLPFCRLPSVGRPRLSAYWARRGGAARTGAGAGTAARLGRLFFFPASDTHARQDRHSSKRSDGSITNPPACLGSTFCREQARAQWNRENHYRAPRLEWHHWEWTKTVCH